ncbi:MAG: hypothetical protein F4X44_11975 [Gammaproteobacteria bacterium]|nr:hypothetical protein [Gammaproteobacteria bacterium]MYD81315.1 hypothetical protein [Gammaproteobacteria bacterium]
MDSQKAKQFRLPFQLLLGIAIGGVATAIVILGVLTLTSEKGGSPDYERSIAISGESLDTTSSIDSFGNSPFKESRDEGHLRSLLRHQGNFDLSLALHIALKNVNENQLQSFLAETHLIEHPSRRLHVQEVIFRRYASLDPKSAVKQVLIDPKLQHEDLLKTVFGEWALTHLDNAIASAKELDGFATLAALRGILESRDDLSDTIRIEIGRQLGNELVAQNTLTQSNLSEAIKDPNSVWDTLIGDDVVDTAQTGTFIQVAEAWIAMDGMSVLGKINNTLTDKTTNSSVLTTLIHQLVQADAQAVFDFARTMENDARNNVIVNVVNAWARLDPEAALSAVQSVESKSLRTSLENRIAASWGSTNPRSVLENLDLLPENAQDMAVSSAISSLAHTAPEEAANLMASMDSSEQRLRTAFEVLSVWANKDPTAALEWTLNNPEVEDLKTTLLPSILYQVANKDPQIAFDIARQQPLGENGVGLEGQVLANIAFKDIEKGLAMLSQVREGPTLNYAVSSVGRAMLRMGDISEIWGLAQKLPESHRQDYYQSVVDSWAARDGTELYESLDSLPSDEIKSYAALKLISFNEWSRYLDKDEVNQARTYLNEQDAEKVEAFTHVTGRRVGVEFEDRARAADN